MPPVSRADPPRRDRCGFARGSFRCRDRGSLPPGARNGSGLGRSAGAARLPVGEQPAFRARPDIPDLVASRAPPRSRYHVLDPPTPAAPSSTRAAGVCGDHGGVGQGPRDRANRRKRRVGDGRAHPATARVPAPRSGGAVAAWTLRPRALAGRALATALEARHRLTHRSDAEGPDRLSPTGSWARAGIRRGPTPGRRGQPSAKSSSRPTPFSYGVPPPD